MSIDCIYEERGSDVKKGLGGEKKIEVIVDDNIVIITNSVTNLKQNLKN